MNRRWLVMLAGVAALGLIVGVAVIDHYHVGVFHDDAMYVILARSIATGQGFRYLNLPDAPVASHFPPGYPAVLSLIWRVAPNFPENLIAFKTLNAVCLALSAALVAQLTRDRLGSERWGIAAGVMTAISVPLLVLVTMVLSEPLFLVTLLAALILAERLVSGAESPPSHCHPARVSEANECRDLASPVRGLPQRKDGRSRHSLRSCGMTAVGRVSLASGLGLLVGIATLVRSHGIVLLPAIALPLLARRRWRDTAIFAIGALAVLVPWQLWTATHAGTLPAPLVGNYGSYVGWWMRGFHEMGASMVPETLRRTVPETLAMLASLFSPVPGAVSHTISLLALGACATLGAMALRRRAPVTLLFLAGYATLVLVWPFPPSRFVWGVWPLLLFVLLAAGRAVSVREFTMPGLLRVVMIVALVWLGVGYAAYEQRAARGRWWASISRSADRRIAPAVEWTLANTASTDIVASDDEGAVFLYTGRHAVPVASFTTGHYLRDRSSIVEAQEGLVPLLATYPLRAVLVGSTRTFEAAQYLATRPVPLLSLRDQFAGGAAFTVLTR